MEAEFDAAAKRFGKEQKDRRATSATKKAAIAKQKAEYKAKQVQWEAEAERRKLEELARAAEDEAARELELERNRGVVFSAQLRPELSTAARDRGIRRANDKISLPRSAQLELEQQQASKNGLLFFELRAADGRVTHGSILEFSAAEGTVGCPAELLRALGLDAVADGTAAELRPELAVRYVFLRPGTYAQVQPVKAAFAEGVGDVKGVLEYELQLRTALTAGEELRLSEAGGCWALRILALRHKGEAAAESKGEGEAEPEAEPEGSGPSAVSLIDTDLEVDVLPSVEYEQAVKEAAAKAAARQAALDAAAAARRREEEEAAAAAAAAAAEAEAAAAAAAEAAAAQRESRRSAAAAVLPPEPAPGTAELVSVAIRCPDGTRCVRPFAPTDAVESLFRLVEASALEDLPEEFALVASYPRRVISRAAHGASSLRDAGLSARQEALFVECEAPPPAPMEG